MSAETGVYALLRNSQELADALEVPLEGLADRRKLFRAGAGIDPASLFLAIRWEEDLFASGPSGRRMLTLRAHDRDRTYDRIDAALDAAKRTLTAVTHQFGITQIDWNGRSPDLIDDGYKTNTRYDTYMVVAGLIRKEG